MSSHDRSTPPRAEEGGVVTAFVVVMAIALLLVTGLVFDGGRAIVAKRHAINVAEQAARAGAQAIDIASVRSSLLTLAGLPVLRGTGQANARTCQGVIQEENC